MRGTGLNRIHEKNRWGSKLILTRTFLFSLLFCRLCEKLTFLTCSEGDFTSFCVPPGELSVCVTGFWVPPGELFVCVTGFWVPPGELFVCVTGFCIPPGELSVCVIGSALLFVSSCFPGSSGGRHPCKRNL